MTAQTRADALADLALLAGELTKGKWGLAMCARGTSEPASTEAFMAAARDFDEAAARVRAAIATLAGRAPNSGRALTWRRVGNYGAHEALVGDYYGGDGVRFHLEFQPTCYRRGRFRLLIDVAGRNHHAWGCFNQQDQPLRYYHSESSALIEAQALADVLYADRTKNHGPLDKPLCDGVYNGCVVLVEGGPCVHCGEPL